MSKAWSRIFLVIVAVVVVPVTVVAVAKLYDLAIQVEHSHLVKVALVVQIQ